jgi:glutamyl-tRNA synthetase
MRKEQEAQKKSTGYDRVCLNLTEEEIEGKKESGLCGVLRFRIPDDREKTSFVDAVRGEITFENRLLDDFVILKSDGYPTYHFASVVDDHLMNITHVIRSEEWISSTPKHVMLYEALGWAPPVWVHPPLILGPDRSKLSKRHGAVRFLDYKERGFLPEAMMNFISLLGWSTGEDQEIYSVDELIQRFSLEGIVNHPVVFDLQKAEWMNGVYMRQASVERITDLCLPYLQEAGLVDKNPTPENMQYVHAVIGLEKDRMKVLSDIVELSRFFFEDQPDYEEKGMKKYLSKEYVPDLLRSLAEKVSEISEFSIETLDEAVRSAGESMEISGGQVIHPIRMAVTGRTVGPGLFETMAVLGQSRIIARLNRTIGVLGEVVTD